MECLHKREGGVYQEIFLGVRFTSERGGGAGASVWNCVKDNIIKEMEQCKAIQLHGFDYKRFV